MSTGSVPRCQVPRQRYGVWGRTDRLAWGKELIYGPLPLGASWQVAGALDTNVNV